MPEGRLSIDFTESIVRSAARLLYAREGEMRRDAERSVLERAAPIGEPSMKGTLLSGEEAAPVLIQLSNGLLRQADRLVARHSAGEWLWYLRRLQGQFHVNDLLTTDPYCQSLVEVLTLRSRTRSLALPRGSSSLASDVTEARIRRVAKLRVLTLLMYEVHGLLRWAGKGCPIRFARGRWPEEEPTPSLEQAVRLYDKRMAESLSLLAPAGLHASLSVETLSVAKPTTTPICLQLPVAVQIPVPTTNSYGITDVHGRYVLGLFDLEDVGVLADSALPLSLRWPTALVDVVALLGTCLLPSFWSEAVITFTARGYGAWVAEPFLQQVGLALQSLRESGLGGLLPTNCVPDDPQELLERLESIQGSVWPPVPGSPIRRVDAGRKLLIDIAGATRLFLHLLARPAVTGAEVNVWAGQFERHVQAVVDRTPAAPSGELRGLRGRTIRLHGQAVTDIDAIAVRDSVLLLLSCKSFPYTSAYDRGEYSAVRNVMTAAQGALKKLDETLSLISSHLRGDNFDFSGFRGVRGAVVLPFTPYVPMGPATQECFPGLRRVVGVDELERWGRVSGDWD